MDTKTLCLGVLSRGEASGYEIRKLFEQAFSHYFVAGYGSIYPALAELNKQRLIACTDVIQERRPAKKVYRLTPEGRDYLQTELLEAYPRHKVRSEFLVLLTFAHLLPQERLEEVLQLRKKDIRETLLHIESCVQECKAMTAGERHTIGFARAVLAAGLDYLEANSEEIIRQIGSEKTTMNRFRET
jgi:PadR family transcriptional regulator AphA